MKSAGARRWIEAGRSLLILLACACASSCARGGGRSGASLDAEAGAQASAVRETENHSPSPGRNGIEHEQPGAARAVRIATFNVQNYLAMDRRVEGKFRPGYPKPEIEKEGVRSAIRAIGPDVLALQEVGPAPFLEELRQDLAQEGLVYPFSFLLEAADPDRHVAVLSRVALGAVVPHPEVLFNYFGGSERVKRGLLELRFGEDGDAWTLFIVHLKSRFTDRSDDLQSQERRTLEARAVRDLILAKFPDPASARFIVAGDFNDTAGSRAIAAFQTRGKLKIARPLPAADTRGETWTHRYAAEEIYSRVDYFFVSPALLPTIAEGRGRIHDGEGALSGSDHRAVYLDLVVGQ